MKYLLLACLAVCAFPALGDPDTPDVAIPQQDAVLIKTTDYIEVSGTNDLGGAESFTIHNAKAISQFVGFLTSERFTAMPKNLKPEFKSMSAYDVRLYSNGALALELKVIADSVLDIPNETFYYMESDRHSDNFMEPLLRLR